MLLAEPIGNRLMMRFEQTSNAALAAVSNNGDKFCIDSVGCRWDYAPL